MIKYLPFLLLFIFPFISNANTPTLNCPMDIVIPASMGGCGEVATFNVTSNGTCPGEVVSQIGGLPSGVTFPVGTIVNTFMVTDDNGNSSTCSFSVTILDQEAPAFVCNQNINAVTPLNSCEAVVMYDPPPFISDNCGANVVSLAHNNSDDVIGSYVCDSTQSSAHLRVFDIATMGVPGNTMITSVDVGIGFAINNPAVVLNLYTLDGPVASYNNMTLLESKNLTLPDLFNTTYNIPFSIMIPSRSVLVAELEVPSNNPSIPGYNIGGGQTAPSYIASSGCGLDDLTDLVSIGETELSLVLKINTQNVVVEQIAGLASGDSFPLGATTNLFLATDASGNSSTCSFDVIVTDGQGPILECPSNIEVGVDTGACGAVVEYSVTSFDNCPGTETISQIAGLPSGAFFPLGFTLNEFVVSDGSGFTDTCRFDVHVIDTEKPVVVCPADIIIDADPSTCSAVVNFDIESFDNCQTQTVEQVSGLPSGSVFPVGTITNTFIATDAVGNKDTCSFDVIVLETSLPELGDCPEDIMVDNDAGECGAMVTFDLPSVTGGCSVLPYNLRQHLVDTVSSAYGCDMGMNDSKHLRVYTLSDFGVQNDLTIDSVQIGIGFVEISQDVTINLYSLSGALQYANMTLLSSETINLPAMFNTLVNIPISATAPAGSTLVAELVIPNNPGNAFIAGYNAGNQTGASYYASDACGYTEPTSLAAIGLDNLSFIMTVFAEADAPSSNGLMQSEGMASGSFFPIGTTTNTFTVTDSNGNTASCSFDVTVNDTEVIAIACPEGILIETSLPSPLDTMLTIDLPMVTDNCDFTFTNDITGTEDASGIYTTGSTDITWTVVDQAANSSTCVTTVEITHTINTQEADSFEALDIFPNPANEFINIKYQLAEAKTVQVELLNILGQQLENNTTDKTADHLIQLNTANYEAGIYFIRLSVEEQVYTHKVVIE